MAMAMAAAAAAAAAEAAAAAAAAEAAAAAAESDLDRELLDVGDKFSSLPSDAEDLLSLLNLAESVLSRVKQRPSDSTCGALHPIMKALVAEGLMNHSEMEIKVALASCFSEITRISAPADPYCENLMKAILRITVEALTDIDDLTSRSHGRKVSILETITEIHSFFMLLDLECDDLILELFHHFLKTARQVNDGRVLSFMETIMTRLLNESEDILLSRLLDCVVNDIKDGLPIRSILGEKVIGNCAEKLKPYLIELVRSNGASCNDYGDIIASICQENSDTSELNKPSTSDECLEGTCLVQEPDDELEYQFPEANLEPEQNLPETNMEGTRLVQEPDDELEYQFPETNLEPEQNLPETNMITPVQEGSSDILGPIDVLDHHLLETNLDPEHNLLETNTAYGNQLPEGTFFHELPQVSGRLEQEVDCPNYPEVEKTFQETTRRSSRTIVKKKFFEEENSITKKQKKNTNKIDSPAKKILKKCGETCTSKSVRKLTKIEASALQKSIIEKLTGELIIIDDLSGEQIPKALDKDQSNLAESSKATLRRKRRRKLTKVNDEGFESENHGKELEVVLIGKRIKVWWPMDEAFYEGVIDSFDPVSKKHKVIYADGDEEELLLKDEHWIELEDPTRDLVCRQENQL